MDQERESGGGLVDQLLTVCAVLSSEKRACAHISPGGRRFPRRRACVRTASSSFDHLVGAQPYQWGYRKVKRLGGLEVQDHLEFYRHLNG